MTTLWYTRSTLYTIEVDNIHYVGCDERNASSLFTSRTATCRHSSAIASRLMPSSSCQSISYTPGFSELANHDQTRLYDWKQRRDQLVTQILLEKASYSCVIDMQPTIATSRCQELAVGTECQRVKRPFVILENMETFSCHRIP